MNDRQWIIVYGGIVSGLSFIGPFKDPDTASDYAVLYKLITWEIAELDSVESTIVEDMKNE